MAQEIDIRPLRYGPRITRPSRPPGTVRGEGIENLTGRQRFFPEETPLVEAVQEPEVLKRLPANTLYDFFGKTLPTGIETLTNLPGIRYTPLNWPSLASQKFTGKRISEHLPRLRDMIPAMEYPEEFREGAESAQFLSEWVVPVGGVIKLSTSGIKALSNLGKIVNRTPVEEMQFQRLRTIHAKSDKPAITSPAEPPGVSAKKSSPKNKAAEEYNPYKEKAVARSDGTTSKQQVLYKPKDP